VPLRRNRKRGDPSRASAGSHGGQASRRRVAWPRHAQSDTDGESSAVLRRKTSYRDCLARRPRRGRRKPDRRPSCRPQTAIGSPPSRTLRSRRAASGPESAVAGAARGRFACRRLARAPGRRTRARSSRWPWKRSRKNVRQRDDRNRNWPAKRATATHSGERRHHSSRRSAQAAAS